jgi:hypothetical protein
MPPRLGDRRFPGRGIGSSQLEGKVGASIVPENIRTAQTIYVAAMFEEIKLFQVADRLVELLQMGMLPIGAGPTGDLLHRYSVESPNRITESERQRFYARVLGIPGGDEDLEVPNAEFPELWLRFISTVGSYARQCRADDVLGSDASVSEQQIGEAGRDLAMNLSSHGSGVAHFVATVLLKQIKAAIALLEQPEIRNIYGARDWYQVVDQVATLELGGAKSSRRYLAKATAGATVMAWLAKNAARLGSASFAGILTIDEVCQPTSPASGQNADPNGRDLADACEQWLAASDPEDDSLPPG